MSPVLLTAALVTLLELRSRTAPSGGRRRARSGPISCSWSSCSSRFRRSWGSSSHTRSSGPRRAQSAVGSALAARWPIWIQAVLMVLVVDFLRYWLHRAAHQNDTLWRLHSVHHSVEQLYWLNTARFHPLEKALQMSLDSLPFLLMQVDADGARAVLHRLRHQWLLPALQHPLALRPAELHRRQRGDASLASFPCCRASRTPTTAIRSSSGTSCSAPGFCP